MANVITGEAVALELPVATFPSRIAALLIDMVVQVALLIAALLAFGSSGRAVSTDFGIAGFIAIVVLALVGYPTVMETATRGRTLGKMALGIRVVGDDGSPVRFRQALVRALVGIFEVWTPVFAPVGLITSLISARGKRVGDVFAGTYVIQERAPARPPLPTQFAFVPPPLVEWARLVQLSSLTDHTAEAAASYLRRLAELNPQARDALGMQLANAVAAQISPPPPAGTPPTAYLAAVLAVRRQQQEARIAAAQPAPPTSPVQTGPVQTGLVQTGLVQTGLVQAAPVPAISTPSEPSPDEFAPGEFAPPGPRPLAPPT
jgi:uncharacterized RDD family membrane protein YckC